MAEAAHGNETDAEAVGFELSRCCYRSKNGTGRKYGHYRMVGLAGSAPPSDEISPYD